MGLAALQHLLLFLLTIPLFIPYVDTLHSTMLFWLRPSKQIRSPIFSFKQRALRRTIIFKSAPSTSPRALHISSSSGD